MGSKFADFDGLVLLILEFNRGQMVADLESFPIGFLVTVFSFLWDSFNSSCSIFFFIGSLGLEGRLNIARGIRTRL